MDQNQRKIVTLLKVVDSWKRGTDNGFKSVIVFLDPRKAFNVIKHEVLPTRRKSYSYGVKDPNFGGSTVTYLRDCSMSSTRVESDPMGFCFGIPQVSVLGPTLFNIHVNNISKECHSHQLSQYMQTKVRYITAERILI